MSKHSFDVIVCGSLHLDILVNGPHLPELDETVVGRAWRQACGGKGGNQAVQAAAFDAHTAFIGRTGNDDFGQRLRSNLAKARVDHSAVTVDSFVDSGMSVAIVDKDGNYGAVIVSGANLHIPPTEVEAAFHRLGGSQILVLQNEVPHAVNLAAAKAARAAGAKVVFNAAPARANESELLEYVDILVVNKVEAAMLAGVPVTDHQSAIKALEILGSADRTVIVTLGGKGLVLSDAGKPPVTMDALKVEVVSTHGAGDCFVGALAAKLAQGDSIASACEFANDAAGRFVSSHPPVAKKANE